jgi:hypothetical protein
MKQLNEEQIRNIVDKYPQLTILAPEFHGQGLRIKNVVKGNILGASNNIKITEQGLHLVCNQILLSTSELKLKAEELTEGQLKDKRALEKLILDDQFDDDFVEIAKRLSKRNSPLTALSKLL